MPARWRDEVRRSAGDARYYLKRFFFYRSLASPLPLPRWLASEARFRRWQRSAGAGLALERPIFMIGCPRSGTTVSVNLFAKHPDVANFSEAMDVWDPEHYLDPEADHHWTAERATQADRERISARFEYHRRLQDKPRFINKNPRNSVRIEYMRALFPDAVFIHVIRDGRGVTASMVEMAERAGLMRRLPPMPFCHPPGWRELVRPDLLEQVALQWEAIVRHARDVGATLGSAYHEYRYEDLCADPRGVLDAAFRAAGLRVDDEVLGLLPEQLESKNYKWKSRWSPEQVEMVTRIQGPLLAELGYSLA